MNMGSKPTKEQEEDEEKRRNGLCFGQCLVSPEILAVVFSFLGARDLAFTCSRVCRAWRNIVYDPYTWILALKRKGFSIVALSDDPGLWTLNDLFQFHLKDPFSRKNLLKNPSGHSGGELAAAAVREGWTIPNNMNHWIVEDPPAGSDSVPAIVGASSCFVTSYFLSSKSQCVNLYSEGFSPSFLDRIQPPILVADWYAARFDCGCEYKLEVELRSEANAVIDRFDFHWREEQWLGKQWHHIHHVFQDYGKGVKYVNFVHHGKDTQFWAGHYGVKIAGSLVKVLIPGNLECIYCQSS